ncbi:DUF3489 domain-containing protein [Novosphingobium sp. ZN18A2]|uniref:DUF3489 domain-containing protein n=1 Tax=Novosphingobium sp. ZN18A2 TaxID=3079861 RepID=UPI0030CCDB89
MSDTTKTKPVSRRPRRMAREPEGAATNQASAPQSSTATSEPSARPQTKAASVEALLAHTGGTTLDAMCEATGWLPHTCRAFLTGLRKKGKTIKREKHEDGTSIYRMVQDKQSTPTEGSAA